METIRKGTDLVRKQLIKVSTNKDGKQLVSAKNYI